ncbi:MAG TPA: Ig-like domain-containing domain, partial [Chitinophagales bacterium]|nr:Ig-like domain-containing domain [Chitinophagales bacterium]
MFNPKQLIRTLHRLIYPAFIALLLTNCANEKAPEGGKKDTTPPSVKKISPLNKSLHFRSNKIQITFDEYIKPTGFAQTLISPPLAERPDFKISGKTLVIKLKSPLRDSTTYTINFAEDIKDVNEGNVLNNFTYVFSTGDFIDSQKVSGKVLNAKDNTAADGVVVSLYPEDSVNGIISKKPYYFAKTDNNGGYRINNIKAGRYHIYALKDQNYNYIFDQPNEQIAFTDSILNLTDTVPQNVELHIFQQKAGTIRYAGYHVVGLGQVQLYFNRQIDTFSIRSTGQPEHTWWYFDHSSDTVNYWFSNFYEKKDTLYTLANDSVLDTARIELQTIDKDSLWANPKYSLSIVNQSNAVKATRSSKEIYNTQELYKPVKIFFSRPVFGINPAKPFQIFPDSSTKPVKA